MVVKNGKSENHQKTVGPPPSDAASPADSKIGPGISEGPKNNKELERLEIFSYIHFLKLKNNNYFSQLHVKNNYFFLALKSVFFYYILGHIRGSSFKWDYSPDIPYTHLLGATGRSSA